MNEFLGHRRYGGVAAIATALVIFGCFGYIAISNDEEFGVEVEKPVISGSITGVAGTYYYNTPLVRFYEEDGVFHARITEATVLSKYGDSECAQKIEFTIVNENAKLKKANISVVLWRDGKIVAESHKGQAGLVVSCDEVSFGDAEYEIVASNTAGTTRKTVMIGKNYTFEACEKFDPGKELRVCQSPQEETKPTQNNGSSSSSGGGASKCLNYQSGKCWDDVEDAGYDDGYDDGWMGLRYGASFFDSLPAGFGNCTGVCEDIYEDAYREGYEDGKWDARE